MRVSVSIAPDILWLGRTREVTLRITNKTGYPWKDIIFSLKDLRVVVSPSEVRCGNLLPGDTWTQKLAMDPVSKSQQLHIPFELRWRKESGTAERYQGQLSFTVESAPEVAKPTGATPIHRSTGLSYALAVGIGDYHHLSSLSKTTTDARDLHALLAQSGYPATNMALLLDDQATKATISDRLDWLAHRAGSDDTVLIFFSGHGARRVGGFEPGEYLCPVEADWYNLHATAISDEELTTALRAIHAGRVAVFLDACHSGGVGEPKDAVLQVKAGFSEAVYARLAEGRGRVVIASCRPDEVSWELTEMRNGLFTHYMLEGLRGAAVNAEGFVGILDLFKYISWQVPRHRPQHPLFKGELELNFALTISVRPPAASVSKAPVYNKPTTTPTTEIDPESVTPTKLRRAIHSAYDRPEFEILCKELGLDYHDLRGETLETKMLYLIDWHQRHRRYATLVRKVIADHPYLSDELH